MDVKPSPYCTVVDKRSQERFLCYTHRKNGLFTICLTDAADVWSSEFTEDTLIHFRQRLSLKSTEDYILKLRCACASGDVSVVVLGTRVDVQVGPGEQSVSLSRLEGQQAAAELKDLLFRMADSLARPHSKGGSPSVSPIKHHQRLNAEFEPRQQQKCAPVKKRLPGASLINPGTKRKVQATGVAFDDADED